MPFRGLPPTRGDGWRSSPCSPSRDTDLDQTPEVGLGVCGCAQLPAPSTSKDKQRRVAHELRNNIPGCPTSTTGVSDKDPRALGGRLRGQSAQTSRRSPVLGPLPLYFDCTGVPNKDYRGAQQALPGSPAKSTGVLDKYYRGAQQTLPGCPTSRCHERCCKTRYFGMRFGLPLFLFLL